MSGDARDFNNIVTRAVIIFFFVQDHALREIHAILIETLGEHAPSYAIVKSGWPSLNVTNFPRVLRLALDDENSDHPRDY
jgi:hypothetical protein